MILKQKINQSYDVIISFLRAPVLWILFSILLSIYNQLFMPAENYFEVLTNISRILLIASLGWFTIKVVKSLSFYLQNKLNIEDIQENLKHFEEKESKKTSLNLDLSLFKDEEKTKEVDNQITKNFFQSKEENSDIIKPEDSKAIKISKKWKF